MYVVFALVSLDRASGQDHVPTAEQRREGMLSQVTLPQGAETLSIEPSRGGGWVLRYVIHGGSFQYCEVLFTKNLQVRGTGECQAIVDPEDELDF